MRPNKGGYERIKRRIEKEPGIKQHAIDQGIHDAIILRKPHTKAEQDAFKRESSIYRTSDGVYYTTVRPLPTWLMPFFLRDMRLPFFDEQRYLMPQMEEWNQQGYTPEQMKEAVELYNKMRYSPYSPNDRKA